VSSIISEAIKSQLVSPDASSTPATGSITRGTPLSAPSEIATPGAPQRLSEYFETYINKALANQPDSAPPKVPTEPASAKSTGFTLGSLIDRVVSSSVDMDQCHQPMSHPKNSRISDILNNKAQQGPSPPRSPNDTLKRSADHSVEAAKRVKSGEEGAEAAAESPSRGRSSSITKSILKGLSLDDPLRMSSASLQNNKENLIKSPPTAQHQPAAKTVVVFELDMQ
jgi:hypothetical protein